jgi:hypothetical protein
MLQQINNNLIYERFVKCLTIGLLAPALFVLSNNAGAADYIQATMARYHVNYRGESGNINATEVRYGTYMTRSLALEFNLAVGGSSTTFLNHGPTNGSINWLGRDSQFDQASVDFKLNNSLGLFASYRKVIGRYDLAGRLGLVQVSYNQTFNAENAIINGNFSTRYKEEIGGADLGIAAGLSALAFVSKTGAVVFEWQWLPQVGDSVRGGDFTKVAAYAFQLGARFHF